MATISPVLSTPAVGSHSATSTPPTWASALASIPGTDVPIPVASLQGAGAAGTSTVAAPQGESLPTPRSGQGEGGGGAPGGGLSNLWMILLIGGVIWFLIFAPERKLRKQRDAMLGALKKGDRVVTTGGLHGQVVEVRENEVTLKCHDTRLTFTRTAVQQVLEAKGDAKAETTEA